MRAFIIALCCGALLGVATFAYSQEAKPRKKKQQSSEVTQQAVQQPATSDPRVGTTKKGLVVYRGKKGGYYVVTPSGRKRYVKEADVILDQPK
jgi:hypothetical protein